ncbi:MAG: hypothetical protein IJQ67_01965 [Bacilli bacterium]|nr:hypothetical protein [Bacilli bacterium]
MDELEKVIRVNNLFQIYGPILSTTQQEMIKDYYEYNLSLAEIAENRNISRSAVDDALKKGVKKLEYYEAQLHFLERNEELMSLIDKLKEKDLDKESKEILKEMERRI